MVIHGFQKLTLLDYPGKVACTLFSGGCNFRCPFCQNGNLVQHPEWEPVIPEEEIFAVLEKRRGVLDGVCVTGGEPTLDPDLERYEWIPAGDFEKAGGREENRLRRHGHQKRAVPVRRDGGREKDRCDADQ